MAFRLSSYEELPSLIEKRAVLSETVQELLQTLRNSQSRKETDDCLLALHSVFGETLERALELVDTNSITYCHTSISEIGLFQVEGSSGSIYTFLPGINFCPCPAFKFQSNSSLTCKHFLACCLAKVIGKISNITISNNQYQDMLLRLANLN